jgi:hypothetical protein
MITEFDLVNQDILSFRSDLLLLKYSQARFGLDWTVASILIGNGVCRSEEIAPAPGEFVILEPSLPIITAKRVMFLGTVGPERLGYDELHAFARRAIEIMAAENLPVSRMTTTIHGVGFGLDAGEAIQHLAVGFLEGVRSFRPRTLQKITFVEGKVRRLKPAASALASIGLRTASTEENEWVYRESVPTRSAGRGGVTLEKRDHVFVAIPFSEEFEDVYEFGIYEPVRKCGYICERVDETSFTGDVLERIRNRVESAKFVIADLTGGRPNVYLEVGYAWGKGVPVIFIAREQEELHFDVKTHRCIYYRTIGQLSKDLERLIVGLPEHGPIAHERG